MTQPPPARAASRRARRGLPAVPRWWLVGGSAVVALALVAAGAAVLPWFVPWWSDGNRPPVTQRIAAGRSHTCAVTTHGTVKCWGDNVWGQLGDGTTRASATPVEVQDLAGVVALSGSGNHTCALTSAGLVFCWGADDSGQLGDGGTAARSVPVRVAAVGEGVRAISGSATHTCALLRSRAVSCWGDNGAGQLGAGTSPSGTGPREVVGLPPRSTAVSAGNGYTCVVFTGRTVRCWGDNGDGQLGVGDTEPRSSWQPVVGLPWASAVSAGDTHSCAVTHDGRVMCWGANDGGQLGIIKAARNALTPMAVPGIGEDYELVAAGYRRTCAVSRAGEVTCWGGSADDNAEVVPTIMAELPPSQDVAVGAFHACALAGTEVWCWGRNPDGQLGDGTVRDHAQPVRVANF